MAKKQVFMRFNLVAFSPEALEKVYELTRTRDIKVTPLGFLTAEEAKAVLEDDDDEPAADNAANATGGTNP